MSTKSKDPIYRLQSHCHITDGPLRSVIVDLDRGKYETIPNDMYAMIRILVDQYPTRWSSVVSSFGERNARILQQYLAWLLEREYVHEVLEGSVMNWAPRLISPLPPSELQDGIVDLSKDGDFSLLTVIRQFERVRCKSLLIRDFDGSRLADLRSILVEMHESIICNVHLYLRASIESIALATEFAAHAHVTIILYHGCDQEQGKMIEALRLPRVHFSSQCIRDEGCCGRITADSFTVNHQFLSASGQANTCLDKKLSIDRYGKVKNCPSLERSWGQAESFDIRKVLSSDGFRAMWSISKDQIGTCKTCEFRDVCSDCRAFLSDPRDLYSKPAKCDYDPSTATWRS